MRIMIRGIGAALLLAVLSACPSQATEKTRVGVAFFASAHACSTRYAPDLGRFNSVGTDSVIAILNQALPFLRFERSAGQTYQIALNVSLRDTTVSNANTSDLGLRLRLTRGGEAVGTCFQTVRDLAHSSERLPSRWDLFLVELLGALHRWSTEQLVEQSFTSVPVADSAMCWKSPLGWVLPFTQDEICLDRSSLLLVDAVVDEGAGPQPLGVRTESGAAFRAAPEAVGDKRYLGRIFTKFLPDSLHSMDGTKALADSIHIRSIRVLRFVRYDQCGLVPAGGGPP